MIISKSLKFVHGTLSILLVNKGNESKTTTEHGFLVLGKIDTANTTKGLKEILQIRFGGVLGNIGHTNCIHIVVSLRASGTATHNLGTRTLRWRHITTTTTTRNLCPATSATSTASTTEAPASTRSIGTTPFSICTIHTILSFHLTTLLLGPKFIQITANRLRLILILQIQICIGIFHIDIISRLNRYIGRIIVQCGLAEFLPLASNGHILVFNRFDRMDAYFCNCLDELLSVVWHGTIRGYDLNTL
mmetsp:Transcript_30909/g.45800  ORF Transcript_30909/g.45800 Transcript_30909/m.45800 type:complete len:247 (+) Transcript_30909:304-1044(+)